MGATTDMSDTDSWADNAASEVSVDDIRVPSVEPDMEVRDTQVNSLEIREAFIALDVVDLTNVFSLRASVLKTVPRFLRGPFRNALRVAMDEAVPAGTRMEVVPSVASVAPSSASSRRECAPVQVGSEIFARGHWVDLLAESQKCAQDASTARKKRRYD